MKLVKVKNTYNLKIKGSPAKQITELETTDNFIVNPKRIKNFKAKLLVKENDVVEIGTPLYTDKKQPHMVFLSPVAGTVEKVELGDRRSIEKIVIKKAVEEKVVKLADPLDLKGIDSLQRSDVVDRLINGGCWALLSEYPFANVPEPEKIPPSIYVSIDYDEPYMPDSEIFLKEYENEFLAGLAVLRKLTTKLNVGAAENNASFFSEAIKSEITHKIRGSYPANDPGVFLYNSKSSVEENKSWGIRSLDVIRLGQLFLTGHYPNERLIVIAGGLAKQPRYIKTRESISLDFIRDELLNKEPYRLISGGVFTGDRVSLEDGLGYHDYALHLLREGQEQEMLSFFRPGFDKQTFSNTYLSAALDKDDWEMTTSLNGGHRACISCGHCEKVCPVGTAPQLVMKALQASDYETAVDYGLLDIVPNGLYTYVCPSKIELDEMFENAKNKLYKDLTA